MGDWRYRVCRPASVGAGDSLLRAAAGDFCLASTRPEHAVWATLVFCSSALVIVAAKSSTTDGVRLLWIVIGEGCLYAIWRGNRSWTVVLILAVAISLELLTKGLIVGVLASIILVLWVSAGWIDAAQTSPTLRYPDGSIPTPASEPAANPKRGVAGRSAGPKQIAQLIVGLLIVAGIVGSWLYLVHQRLPNVSADDVAGGDGHALKGMEGHGGPPGMHLLFIWADFLPWSLLLPAAIVIGWIHRGEPLTRFALAAVIGPWLLVELAIKTKLPQYMLPTFPALSFLTADAIVRGFHGTGPDFSSRQFVGAARIWAGVIILIGLLPWLAALRFGALPWIAMSAVSVGAAVWAVLVVRLLQRRQRTRNCCDRYRNDRRYRPPLRILPAASAVSSTFESHRRCPRSARHYRAGTIPHDRLQGT